MQVSASVCLRAQRAPGADAACVLPPGDTDLIDRVPAELWQARLGLSLLRQRGKGAHSAFAPYIELLPSVHHGVPMFFDGDTLGLLQYPPLVEQVKKRCRFLIEFSKHIDPAAAQAVFSNHTIDANALGWALVSVSSRAFRVGGGGEDRRALLPLIDMANHR